jgi:steroid delta-isomerase-like uncharacterized protein
MSAAGKALVHRWFEDVWNGGRSDLIDELMAPHCVFHGLGPETMGPVEFKSFYHAYRGAFPDVTIRIEQSVGEENLVAVCWTGSGTHRGDTLGFPATGKSVRFHGMTMARIADNRLVEGWNSFDQLGMLQQLGVAAIPG